MSILLDSKINRYNGCWVTTDLPDDPELFLRALDYSLPIWQSSDIKVVWLTIPETLSSLIPVALSQGFDFHHVGEIRTPLYGGTLINGEQRDAQHENHRHESHQNENYRHESHQNENYRHEKSLILTKRLVPNSIIPEFANHKIGVGGIVFNDKNQVLTVVEKHDMLTRPGHLKFPGGAVDRYEMIRDAVVREVFEETGVRAQFNGVVGLRHYHKGQFATSDCYFLCHLTACDETITPCPQEIGLAQWTDIDAYLAMESVIEFNKEMLKAAMTKKYMQNVELGMLLQLEADEYEIYIT